MSKFKTCSLAGIALGTFAIMFCLSSVVEMYAADNEAKQGGVKGLFLYVKLDSPYNKGTIVAAEVKADGKFSAENMNGNVKNTISGEVSGPVKGKYAVVVTIQEMDSKKGFFIKETYPLSLELEKRWSVAALESGVFARSVLLSEKTPPK